MKRIIAEIFVRIYGPLHGFLLRALAYGPWGLFHQISIWIFARIYGIERPAKIHFKTLGDFFLRDTLIQAGTSALQSPVEATAIEGPAPLNFENKFSVKGLSYSWTGFTEIPLRTLSANTRFWNLYLAPHNYHWVHAPCDGTNLTIHEIPGKKWPVNGFGRFLCPRLYLENDRVSFCFNHPSLGKVFMICVGAMGVSSLRIVSPQATSLKQGDRLLAFELGSTVLLIVENPAPSRNPGAVLRVGDDL